MTWTSDRARLAALMRYRATDDPEVRAAQLDLAVARLETHVQRVVDTFPPLTAEQRDRIAILLRPVTTQQHDAAEYGGDAA